MKKNTVFLFILVFFCFCLCKIDVKAVENVTVNTEAEMVQKINDANDDTIIKLSDSFPETVTSTNISLNKNIAITIDGGAQKRTLKATTNQKHFVIANNSSKPFTFKNIVFLGDNTSDTRSIRTGGINISGGDFIFESVSFNNNYVGIKSIGETKSLTVNNSLFTENYNTGGAGAITGEVKISTLNVNSSSFIGNIGSGFGYNGGAIWLKYAQDISLENSLFSKNISDGTGGGAGLAMTVGSDTGMIKIDNCLFEENKADTHVNVYPNGSAWSDGGAIYLYSLGKNQKLDISNSTFDSNYAQDDGGAILIERVANGDKNTETKIVNNTFVNNNANGKGIAAPVKNGGGAIQLSINVKADIIHNTFTLNNAGGIGESQPSKGGAIASYEDNAVPEMVLKNNIIFGNTIKDGSGIVVASNYSNLEGNVVEDRNNIGVDNGANLSSDITMKSIFATNTPTLSENYSKLVVGEESTSKNIKTIPIIPQGIADNKGIVTTIINDSRKFSRGSIPDIGAIDIKYVKYNGNEGVWDNLPPLNFDGVKYYEQTKNDEYFSIGYDGYSEKVINSTNLKKDGYIFKGWSTTPNGAVKYIPGDTIVLNEDINLFAVWQAKKPIVNVTVTFIMNDPNKKLENELITIKVNESISSSNKEMPKPETKGYTFKGWCTENTNCINDNKKISAKNSIEFTKDTLVAKNIKVYAQWQKEESNDNQSQLSNAGLNNNLIVLFFGLSVSLLVIRKVKNTQ